MTETDLQEAIVRHAIELQRLSANDEAEALAIMRDLEDDLARLLATGDLTTARRRDIEFVLRQAREAIEGRYASLANVVDMQEVVFVVSDQTTQSLSIAYNRALAPTRERLASLASSVLIDGAPSAAWWGRQSEDTAFRFAREVRAGVLEGATNEQITARVLGRGDEVGILETSRRSARALVHSSIMTSANYARLETYRNNSKYVGAVRWLATLDTRTCITCAALDGRKWDLEGNPIGQRGKALQFQAPPAHFNCRCVLSPVGKGFTQIFGGTKGAKIDEIFRRGRRRASADGPTDALTFSEFLRRQSPEWVEESLGAERAELWRQGKITLRDLVSGSGRELTLDQIKARL